MSFINTTTSVKKGAAPVDYQAGIGSAAKKLGLECEIAVSLGRSFDNKRVWESVFIAGHEFKVPYGQSVTVPAIVGEALGVKAKSAKVEQQESQEQQETPKEAPPKGDKK